MTKVDINYEMVIQQQQEEQEAREREWEEARLRAEEPVDAGPSTTWVCGRGRTEEEAERDARSRLSPAQAGAILERRVSRKEPTTRTCYGAGALEQSRETVQKLTRDHCVVVETKELPARAFSYRCRARSRRAASRLVRRGILWGCIPDPQDPSATPRHVDLKGIRALPTAGNHADRLVAWILGRRAFEADLEIQATVTIVYVPPVDVAFEVPERS